MLINTNLKSTAYKFLQRSIIGPICRNPLGSDDDRDS